MTVHRRYQTIPARTQTAPHGLPPAALTALNDFQILLYRLFGVHATIHVPFFDPVRNPWDWARPWVCMAIREKPGLIARCDCSEASLCAIARRRGAVRRCHAGLDMFAVPIRRNGATLGHVVCSPLRVTAPVKPVVQKLSENVSNFGYDPELIEQFVVQMPVISLPSRAAIAAFVDGFFGAFLTRDWKRNPGGFEVYHTPIRSALDLDAWVGFTWAGFETRSNEPTEGGWHLHRAHDILFYSLHGPSVIELPRRRVEVRQGVLVPIPAGQRYRFAGPAGADAAIRPAHTVPPPAGAKMPFWIHYVSNIDLRPIAFHPLVPHARVLDLLRTIIREHPGDMYGFRTREKFMVLQLLLELQRFAGHAETRRGRAPQATMPDAVQRARRHLEENLGRRVTLADLSRVAGLNVFTLCRHFLREFGVPPQAWHRQLRVQEGARLLRETRMPTKAIAARLGFADAHHFSRVFREHMGLPPRRYRMLSSAE